MPEATAGRGVQLVLGFDFGLRRIGVARGDSLTRTAAPLAVVPAGPKGPRWDLILSLMQSWQPALIVVGLPYNTDGSESAMTGAARAFAGELELRYALPVKLVDERYSSLEAQAGLQQARESGLRRRVTKGDLDAAAACVILERWFSEAT